MQFAQVPGYVTGVPGYGTCDLSDPMRSFNASSNWLLAQYKRLASWGGGRSMILIRRPPQSVEHVRLQQQSSDQKSTPPALMPVASKRGVLLAPALPHGKHSQQVNLVVSSPDASCHQAWNTVAIGPAAPALPPGKHSQSASLVGSSPDASCQQAWSTVAIGPAAPALPHGRRLTNDYNCHDRTCISSCAGTLQS